MVEISLNVNGQDYSADVEPRLLLIDFLRDHLGLTGTKSDGGSISGSCTVLLNGVSVKSSLILAVQAHGSQVMTVEGLANEGQLNPLQEAFWEAGAVQSGYSTPGLLMSLTDLLTRNPHPSEPEIRAWLDGVISRDTGYQNVIRAVQLAAQKMSYSSI